jgi:peptidoglycan/LPS O-acetylase OafA/YrhL
MTGIPAERGRVGALDILRFIAALAVVFYHYTYLQDAEPGGLSALTLHGYLGVNLFFMISGFVVLWSARDRTASGFARARILRLYPEFWLSVLIAAAVYLAIPGASEHPIDGPTVLLNLTMVPQLFRVPYVDGVYWTLFPELKFYALLWVLLAVGQMRNAERWLALWLVVAAAVYITGYTSIIGSLVLHPYGPLFIAGCLFFLVYDSGWTIPRLAGVLLCLAISAHYAVVQIPGFVAGAHITDARRIESVLLIASFFAMFGIVSLRSVKIPASRITMQLGFLTYPLYLLHNTGKAIFLSRPLAGPRWLWVGVALVFSLALSAFVVQLARVLVKPWLRRLLGGAPPRPRMATAVPGSAHLQD